MKPFPLRVLGALIALVVLSGASCEAPPSNPTWDNQQRLERGHYG